MSQPAPSHRVLPFEWDRLICFTLGILICWLLQLAWPMAEEWWQPKEEPAQASARPLSLTNYVHTSETPAGRFEYVRLPLGEPDDLLPDVRVPLPAPRWYFAGHTAAQFKRLFRASDLTDEQRTWLMNPAHWEPARGGLYVTPPLELVAGLSRLGRGQIYSVLAESPVNSPQHNPYRFPMNAVEERLADCGLTTNTWEVLRRLLYGHEGTVCFADGAIAQQLLTTEEFGSLVKALNREPTFLMRLMVNSQTDTEQVLRYWSKAGCGRQLKPILESLAKVPGGAGLNVHYLLPPLARQRLYTYAPASSDPAKSRRNCFWTALNFFDEQPDERFLEPENVLHALQTEYHAPEGGREFGDVICLMDVKDKPVHMCVYIADDVVFTKNGIDSRAPWVLMKISDMLVEYPSTPPLKMVTLRRNGS
ncbi:MAG TPA: hypothetical protein VFT34_10445 [Verrucomicrobiae bacterium]|nr:hypothetical protein [Verrucomicrobiae bacterium]